MQFVIKQSSCNVMNMNYNNKIINSCAVKFLGIIINNIVSWKSHMDMITPKLSQVCYIVRVVKLFVTGYPKNYLLWLFSLCYDLWGNILEKFPHSDNIFR